MESRRSSETHSEAQEHKGVEEQVDQLVFIDPEQGTEAAQALAANAGIELSRIEKVIKKKVKRPKLSNLTRNHKTRKSRQSSFSQNFKGKAIDGVHELYTLTFGMSFGIRVAIGRQDVFEIDDLTLEDFMHVDKYVFPPLGNSKSPHRTPPHSLKHTFKFKNYAPKVFRRLRNLLGIDSANYMMSVCGDNNYLEFISNSKSGQFFFYSHDGRYMIKTQTREENKFLRRILPHYYKYVVENPHTQLVRFYGMHRVKMYHLRRKVHFVIMGSVFDTTEMIHTIYDLKGSSVGRSITPAQREKGAVRKDMDMLNDGVKLQLGSKKEAFMRQIEKDAHFLAKLNIMDYSLLVGIHDIYQDEPTVTPPSVIIRSNTPFRRHLSISHGRANSIDPQDSTDTTPRRQRSTSSDLDTAAPAPAPATLNEDGPPSHHLPTLDERETKSDDAEEEEEDDNSSLGSADDQHMHHEVFEDVYHSHLADSMFVDRPADEGASRHARSPSARVTRSRTIRPWASRPDGGIVSQTIEGETTGVIYYTGIIDILQQYNTVKFAEHFLKSFTENSREISSVPAAFYANRFVSFIDQNST